MRNKEWKIWDIQPIYAGIDPSRQYGTLTVKAYNEMISEIDRLTRINAEAVEVLQMVIRTIERTTSPVSDNERDMWLLTIYAAKRAISRANEKAA